MIFNRYLTATSIMKKKGKGMCDKKLTAKQYLEQLEVIDEQINQNLERLEDMKTDAVSTGSIDYSNDRVRTSISGDRLCNDVVRYMSLSEQINSEIDDFIKVKNQIIREIRGLRKKDYIQVLYKIYAQYKSIRQVANEMKMSYSYVVEVHKKALVVFEKTYKNLHYLS